MHFHPDRIDFGKTLTYTTAEIIE